jgi:hypothetical protein
METILWEHKSNKSIQLEKMHAIFDFHALKTIHGWYLFSNLSIILSSTVQSKFEITFYKYLNLI